MNKKAFIAICSAFIISATMTFSSFAAPTPTPTPTVKPSQTETEKTGEVKENGFPNISSEALILIDMKTGDVLFEKDKSKKMYPASTTKIMTGIIALEKGNLSDSVTASRSAIEPITSKHSHMGIKVGETLTLEQLMYGMLVYSANDAANVIAEHIAGSLDEFSKMMNEKAAELGMTNTHYNNAHGYHDDEHYTTAEDLAIVARYAMQNEKFREIVSTVMYRIPANEYYTEERVLSTTNHLISRYRNRNYFYKYAIGIKTGYTDESGSCLVAAAVKDKMELLSVVLKAENSFEATSSLYEYTFENYKYCSISAPGEIVSDSPVYEARGGVRVALTPKTQIEKLMSVDVDTKEITPEIKLNEKIKAPIKKGDVMGSVTYSYQGKTLGTVELIAENDVKRDYFLAFLHLILNILTSPFFFIPVILIVWFLISENNKRKKRRKKRRSRLKYANQLKSK